MDGKAISGNVVTAVVTAAVMGVLAWAVGVFEKGTDAANKETIREVLNETLITDAGKTYGQALSEIGLGLNTVSTQVGELQTDVNQLEDAVLALASE